jgi:hypothetical protein
VREADILYENPTHWVARAAKGGFEVYRIGITHSTRCATIGYEGDAGLQRAKAEADRRHNATMVAL